jgi:hypothetical protein
MNDEWQEATADLQSCSRNLGHVCSVFMADNRKRQTFLASMVNFVFILRDCNVLSPLFKTNDNMWNDRCTCCWLLALKTSLHYSKTIRRKFERISFDNHFSVAIFGSISSKQCFTSFYICPPSIAMATEMFHLLKRQTWTKLSRLFRTARLFSSSMMFIEQQHRTNVQWESITALILSVNKGQVHLPWAPEGDSLSSKSKKAANQQIRSLLCHQADANVHVRLSR